MRMRPAYLAAVLSLLLGAAGLVWGAFSADTPAGSDPALSAGPPDGVTAGDITVSGAYVRQPASPDVVAAYLTMTNNGSQPDTLVAIATGDAKTAALHDVPGLTPAGSSGSSGTSGEHTPTGPLTLAPGQTLTLAPGRGHIMLENPAKALKAGDQVFLTLIFQRSGQLLVTAPVIAISAPAPTGGTTR
jgi:periplasmic copper chaperone A